jgi:hypothetical protein
MHRASDTMSSVFANNRTPFTSREFFDGRANVAKSSAIANFGNARIAATSRYVDDVPRFGRRAPHDKRR